MSSVSFRRANDADVPALLQLIHAAYREPNQPGWTSEAELLGGQRIDAEMLGELLGSPDVEVIVGVDVDVERIVACGALRTLDGGDRASFGMFAVAPDRQGGGIGRSLLHHVESTARAGGVMQIQLQVIGIRRPLLDWYGRLGYRPTGATLPFPYGDERFGLPKRDDLEFVVLERRLAERDGALPSVDDRAPQHNDGN